MIREPPRSTRTANSFPTRRSSDREQCRVEVVAGEGCVQLLRVHAAQRGAQAFADHLARKLRGVGAEQGCQDVPAHARALRLAPGADVFQQQVAEGGGVQSRPAAFGLGQGRSEEHTSELQSLMRISYAVFCLKKK